MPDRKISIPEKLRYKFDTFMDRGTISLIFGLAVISFIVLLIISIGVFYIEPIDDGEINRHNLFELIWISFLHLIDQGTISGTDGTRTFVFAMLVATVCGIFSLSLLISILTNGLFEKLQSLKDGRSLVVEKDHVVILGWSNQVMPTICELINGADDKKLLKIVVLGQEKKSQMYRMIIDRIKSYSFSGNISRNENDNYDKSIKRKLKNLRIICRSGNPADLNDILIPRLNTARSIIVLAPETSESDLQVMKTLLSIKKTYNTKLLNGSHIIAEFNNDGCLSAAAYIKEKFNSIGVSLHIINRKNIISKIISQTCRQTGLSDIFLEIFGFSGNEIYVYDAVPYIGKTIGEISNSFKNIVVLGLWDKAQDIPLLNPKPEFCICENHELILLCESYPDKIIQLDLNVDSRSVKDNLLNIHKKTPEHTLIIGHNSKFFNIVGQIDEYVSSGSSITLSIDKNVIDIKTIEEQINFLEKTLVNQKVNIISGDATNYKYLDEICPLNYNHVILLGYSDVLNDESCDARTVITLLNLRNLEDRNYRHINKYYSVVAEMCDTRNRDILEITGSSDFIVSDRLVSLLIAQGSDNTRRLKLFDELLSPEGCEIYLKLASDYCEIGKPISVADLVKSTHSKSETFVGIFIKDKRCDGVGTGVFLNPAKDEIVCFENLYDRIIVLSETG